MPGRIKVLSSVVLAAALVAGGLSAYRLLSRDSPGPERQAVRSLDVYGAIPSFSFLTQEGAVFTDMDMRGHATVINFIFTRCPTVCPVFSMKMQRLAGKLDEGIELISFSVDPEYDTPARLAEYASDLGVNPKRWHFLTGDAKAVRETVEGAFKIAMEREGVDEEGVPDIVHGTHFVLVDGEGRIRGYYNSDDAERIETLIRDATRLSKENSGNS